jgi:hypothetical protein
MVSYLTAQQQVATVSSTARGIGFVVVKNATAVSVTLDVQGLTPTSAHIHAGGMLAVVRVVAAARRRYRACAACMTHSDWSERRRYLPSARHVVSARQFRLQLEFERHDDAVEWRNVLQRAHGRQCRRYATACDLVGVLLLTYL